MLSNRINKILTVLFLISIAFSKIGYAQDDVIRVNTNLVTIPTMVSDRNGRYITNLKKEDFQIFEDGVEQEITFFEPVEKSFTVLLLLDRSGSMGGEHRIALTSAANVFVKQLRPDDQLIAATFADNVITLFRATKLRDLKKGIKIENLANDSTTLIYDAVDDAIKKMKKVDGRKAIVLFSDGVGDGYFSSAKKNLRDAEELDVMIYTVQFDTSSTVPKEFTKNKRFHEGLANAKKYMDELAARTRGRHYQIENISDLEKTFGAIAGELGQQYTLGYYPKTEAKEKREARQIKVKVKQPNLVVQARKSYAIEPNK
jgi:Ca-activated chloride channel family protein